MLMTICLAHRFLMPIMLSIVTIPKYGSCILKCISRKLKHILGLIPKRSIKNYSKPIDTDLEVLILGGLFSIIVRILENCMLKFQSTTCYKSQVNIFSVPQIALFFTHYFNWQVQNTQST